MTDLERQSPAPPVLSNPPGKKVPTPLNYAPPTPPAVPTYRKVLAYCLIGFGLILVPLALSTTSEAARANIFVTSFGLIMWGLVIRFQHIEF